MTALSHPFVIARFVEPSMEALALNRRQRALVFDPSEECDSIIEHLLRLRADDFLERDHLRRAATLALRLAKLNDGEAVHVKAISGTADRLARDLHGAERTGARRSLKAKAIANRVRSSLKVLAVPRDHSPRAYLKAAWAVSDLFRDLPEDMIFSAKVEYELGAKKFRQLRDLWEERTS